MKAIAWEFKLNTSPDWVLIQGSGGQIGNGSLHVDLSDPGVAERVQEALFLRAKRQCQKEGGARIWVDYETDPEKRIGFMEGALPVAIRARLENGWALQKEESMEVTITIDDKFLEDQVDGANIDYWCQNIFVQADGFNGVVVVTNNDEAKKYALDWVRAVKVAVEKYPYILDRKRMDAETGDIWVQLAAFGEVRYSW